ncbi:MAG TPA: A/G-specific adenine glycosylase [Coxiellaceae bacterium]|nr:A/G-specific adenine glycosylase [Coxiellaceae bacterium]
MRTLPLTPRPFGRRILAWYDQFGRHQLPWKQNPTPYRVWVSEIMLQQTQVATVIDYYAAFMKRFPTLKTLAGAPEDEVLALWSGLGYYSRARNLHKTAKIIDKEYKGRFPDTLEAAIQLPGVGRSTAGAILSLSMGAPTPILDGNVKRVLARYFAISGWAGEPSVQKKLWEMSERYTPSERTGDYNQALMDMGSGICTRTQPQCIHCPLEKTCQAHAMEVETQYPSAKPKKERPQKSVVMIVLSDGERILLEKRPSLGIWGGLWSLPECSLEQSIREWVQIRYPSRIRAIDNLPLLKHAFSHYELTIHPRYVKITRPSLSCMESDTQVWYKEGDKLPGGLPAPIKKILNRLKEYAGS